MRIAKEGSFICNFHSGGTPRATTISEQDAYICRTIKDFLVDNEIFFAGIDIIGNFLEKSILSQNNLFVPETRISFVNLVRKL